MKKIATHKHYINFKFVCQVQCFIKRDEGVFTDNLVFLLISKMSVSEHKELESV